MNKTIVVLGGSFNPPTKAHTVLLESAVKQLDAEFGIFVPASDGYVSKKIKRHGGKDKLYTEQTRLKMLNAICATHPSLRVSTCEYGDDGKGHTYDTLCKIQEEYPDHKIFFVVGADKVHQLPVWHHSDKFFKNFEFAVTKRKDIDLKSVISKNLMLKNNKHIFHEITIDESVSDISSTTARKLIKDGKVDELKEVLNKEIIKYV